MDLSKSYEFFQPEKDKARIHIIGCGSVGSTVAENIARCGVKNITLWDFDIVEPHNLANQIFRKCDIGKLKTEALANILFEINPELSEGLELKSEGWKDEIVSGYVFLCVDNIELRKTIVEAHFDSPYVKAMFDFRTGLTDAQHYAADWKDYKMKKVFLASMNFTHEEAKAETPVSACNVTLSVCPTVRIICAYGVANFMNFWNGQPLKKTVQVDAFNFALDAFN